MSDTALTISFATPDDAYNTYWLRMELVEEDDQMSVGEAADIIDALYDVSVCGQEGVGPEPDEKPDEEDWRRALIELGSLSTCEAHEAMDAGDSGAYELDIKVWRSHPKTELYKLILSNGSAGQPQRVEERITETFDVEEQSSITMDMPIMKNPAITWQDIDGPDIHIKGNTLYWEGKVSGVIRAEFDTVYDLIHIRVTGITNMVSSIITGTETPTVGGIFLGVGWYSGSETGEELTDVQDIECSVLAFYHYQYEELVLHKPEIDESVSETDAAAICYQAGSTHVQGDETDDDNAAICRETCDELYQGSDDLAECYAQCSWVCYKRVEYKLICTCGGDNTFIVNDEPIPCPPGYRDGSIINRGERPENGGDKYVDCGHDGEVHKEEFYEETCCIPWPFGDTPLPYCEVNYAPFLGQPVTEEQIAEIKRAWGDNANIISVGPVDGACGQIITTQKVNQLRCCDGITPLVWDYENSGEVIAPGSSVLIYILGGKNLLEVSVRGSGFWLNGQHTIRDGQTGRVFRVYADSEACGSCDVIVNDGCSDVTDFVVCTEGRWGPRTPIDVDECPVTDFIISNGGAYGYSHKIESTKVILLIDLNHSGYNGPCQRGFVITVRHCSDCHWSLPCSECGLEQWPPHNPEANCSPGQPGYYYDNMCAPQNVNHPTCATGVGRPEYLSSYYNEEWAANVFYQQHMNRESGSTGTEVDGLCISDGKPGQTFAIYQVNRKAVQRWIC